MKPSPFKYHSPKTAEDVAKLLGRLEDTRLLAGGQSLMPMMNFRFVQPAHLIDLSGVQGLEYIKAVNGIMEIGATTRQRQIQKSTEIGRAMPIIHEALSHVGHRQTRARGTIGGSLCHFDPSAELVNIAALHDMRFIIQSALGEREIGFEEFGLGYLTTSLTPEEFLKAIRMPIWPGDHGHGFEEFSLRHGDFAICAVSCLITLARDGRIDRLAIAISGLSDTPVRLKEQEARLRGAVPDQAAIEILADAAGDIDAMSDAYVSAIYRKHLARVLTKRAFTSALKRLNQKEAA